MRSLLPSLTAITPLLRTDVLGPPVSILLNPRPRWRLPVIRLGCCLCPLSLLLSSFAKAVSPSFGAYTC